MEKGLNRFQRKPAEVNQSQGKIVSYTKQHQPKRQLGLQTNIINYVIQQHPKEARLLDSPLFSVQGTPVRSTLGDYLPQDSLNKYNPMMRLQYSPDSICSRTRFCQMSHDESLLLADQPQSNSIHNTKKRDYELTTKSQLSDKCSNDNMPACSLFKLNDDTFGLKVVLMSISSYVFKIDYEPIDSRKVKELYGIERSLFSEDKLLLRMKKYFKDKPFELFYFYSNFLKKWNSTALRRFLIEKGINYSSENVKNLEQNIAKAIELLQVEQAINFLFITRETEDIFILNLEGKLHCETLDVTCNSLWQAFAGYISANNYFRGISQFSTPLEIFLAALF